VYWVSSSIGSCTRIQVSASMRLPFALGVLAAHRMLTWCTHAAYNMLMEGVQDFIDNPGHRCV
jgi:hypothetical protein